MLAVGDGIAHPAAATLRAPKPRVHPSYPRAFKMIRYLSSHYPLQESTKVAQYQGVVRWFNNAKGYGFLGRDGGPDVFVHFSSIQTDGYKSLKEGETVEYDVIQGDKGPQADQVTRSKQGA